jgi:hypothetical protein
VQFGRISRTRGLFFLKKKENKNSFKNFSFFSKSPGLKNKIVGMGGEWEWHIFILLLTTCVFVTTRQIKKTKKIGGNNVPLR